MKNSIKLFFVILMLVFALASFSGCKLNEELSDVECKINGHSIVIYVEEAPTCTDSGLTHGIACEKCDYTEVVRTEIEPLGHDMGEADCTHPSSCKREGCSHTEGEALGHVMETIEALDPVCESIPGHSSYSECTRCGYKEGMEQVTVEGHTYERGVCKCGENNPNYVDYYLIGYINGADYGCESDYENLGIYKFVDGKLTVRFDQDSYVFVKTGSLSGENVKWYLCESYVEGKEAVLVEGKSEKMKLPGGVDIVLTLTVNDNGTITLVADYQ